MAARTRREALKAAGTISSGSAGVVGIALASIGAVAAGEREPPDHVTISYDETAIKAYQPSLVLEDVEPAPQAFHALHAESSDSSLNAVYGVVKYPYQEGIARQDSHLGDHEPFITWYDPVEAETVRIDYAAYHWFRGSLSEEAIATETDARKRPVMRVDPSYHHYYRDSSGLAGTRLDLEDLTASIGPWLDEGLEEALALSQPYNPWEMLSRESWWRHSTGNWLDAWLKALWFDLGLSDARETSDVEEVETW